MKHTKKALLASALSMLLCVSMLIGSTFAWFTDSVTSGKNQIVAGNLEIELEYKPAEVDDTTGSVSPKGDWTTVKEGTELFNDGALWEPGHTEIVYLRVRNAGSLALRYDLSANVYGNEDGTVPEKEYENIDGGKFKLSQYLVFHTLDGAEALENREAAWLAGGESAEKDALGHPEQIGKPNMVLYPKSSKDGPSERIFTLSVYMPEWVGNEANYKTGTETPQIYLGLKLIASQTPYESDSFGPDYDLDSTYKDGSTVIIDTATATASDDGPTVFRFPGNTPTGKRATTVTFEAGALEAGDEYELRVATNAVRDIEGERMSVAVIDLSLFHDGELVTKFESGKSITIDTYISDKLEDVDVLYNKDGTPDDSEDYKESYIAGTGELSFVTTHLSEYVVYAKAPTVRLVSLNETNGLGNRIIGDPSHNAMDYKVQKIVFCDFADVSDKFTWEDGEKIDQEDTGERARLFREDTEDGLQNVYICFKDVVRAYLWTDPNMRSDSIYRGKRLFSNLNKLTTVEFKFPVFTEEGTDFSELFNYCKALESVDLSGLDTSGVTNLTKMFNYCQGLQSIDLSGLNVSGVTTMTEMFNYCSKLTEVKGLTGWDTHNVKDMSRMFYSCKAIETLDMTGLDTSSVTGMGNMFYGCKALREIKGIGGWNTESLTSIGSMFDGCSNLTEIDLSGWNTSRVTSMGYAFHGCNKLQSIDLSAWNTAKVTNMNNMFQGCEKLTVIDLTGWDTANVTTMNMMFHACSGLETIYASESFVVTDGCNDTNMFGRNSKDWNNFHGGAGTPWSRDHVDGTYAQIDGADNPGYFTKKA